MLTSNRRPRGKTLRRSDATAGRERVRDIRRVRADVLERTAHGDWVPQGTYSDRRRAMDPNMVATAAAPER